MALELFAVSFVAVALGGKAGFQLAGPGGISIWSGLLEASPQSLILHVSRESGWAISRYTSLVEDIRPLQLA